MSTPITLTIVCNGDMSERLRNGLASEARMALYDWFADVKPYFEGVERIIIESVNDKEWFYYNGEARRYVQS